MKMNKPKTWKMIIIFIVVVLSWIIIANVNLDDNILVYYDEYNCTEPFGFDGDWLCQEGEGTAKVCDLGIWQTEGTCNKCVKPNVVGLWHEICEREVK